MDPLSRDGGLNLDAPFERLSDLSLEAVQPFAFALLNPLSFSDPLGLCAACDPCPSGKWNYDGWGFSLGVGLGGVAYSRGNYACDGKPGVRAPVLIKCRLGAGTVAAGVGFEGGLLGSLVPGGCGCRRSDLYTRSEGVSWTVPLSPIGITASRCGDGTSSGMLMMAKSVGGGASRTRCSAVPRYGWWDWNFGSP